MSWNRDLTEEQINAVSHTGMHACLLAGPGTGKTLCLTRRIIYLITELNIPPSNIVALTFTRAAAAELRSRIRFELHEDLELPHVLTLHSFALTKILRDFTGASLPRPIRIADDYEERHIIVEELKQILQLGNISEIQDLLHQLSADWEKLTADETDWEQRFPNPTFLGAWREHRAIFGYILRSELVYQLKNAIIEGEIDVNEGIDHLLIDEYQDLNACELEVIRRLTTSQVELYVAGDDDQSIYGFRYANPEGIRQFEDDFEPSNCLKLQECKRCDQRILDIAQFVASQDPRRVDKVLRPSDTANPGEVNILRFLNQTEEARGVAEICKWLIEVKHFEPQEILILLRSDRHHQFSEPLRQTLSEMNIPVATVANPLASLDKEDGRQLLCLLRLIDNVNDNLAWRTLLKIRNNRIGDVTLSRLYEIARSNGQTFYETLTNVANDPSLIANGGNNIKSEFENINSLIQENSEEDWPDIISFINNMIQIYIEDPERRSEIQSLFDRVFRQGTVENLNQLLRALNTSIDNNEQEMESDSVNIMTMHQAKGLSSDVVFVVAAEDEYIPGRAVGTQIEDERRLLYVTLTRARNYLYITHCQDRLGVQTHTGSTSGRSQRSLTQFLSGGPVQSQNGFDYIRNL